MQGDGEKKEGLTPSSYLILFCSFFFLPAKQRPHSQQHGDEAGRAAHKVGDGLGQEHAVCAKSAHSGQDQGQRDHDDHLPEQGEEDRLLGAAQGHGCGLAGKLQGHHEEA